MTKDNKEQKGTSETPEPITAESSTAPTGTSSDAPATGSPEGTTPDGAQVPQANLTIGDLRLVARLVQVSSERGAIRADEMATVGDLYNRLVQFLNTVAPQPAPQPAAEGTADDTKADNKDSGPKTKFQETMASGTTATKTEDDK